MSEEISLRELAKRLGITSYNAIYKAVSAGRIKRLANGSFLWPETKDDWENNRDISKVRDENIINKSPSQDTSVLFFRARAKNEFLKGKKTELEIDVMEKNLIDKDYACKAAFAYSRQMRDIFINSVSRYAPEMAARIKVDEFTLTQELDNYIHDVLVEISQCAIRI